MSLSEGRAVCTNIARTDLCGGCRVTGIPTATLLAVEKIFSVMRCMDTDDKGKRWVWLYTAEAERLVFENSYAEIPESLRPIIIGSFFQKPDNILVLDLRSVDRALKAITFFDKYIPRKHAKVLHMSILNRFSEIHESKGFCFDCFFDDYPKKHKELQDFDDCMNSIDSISEVDQKRRAL